MSYEVLLGTGQSFPLLNILRKINFLCCNYINMLSDKRYKESEEMIHFRAFEFTTDQKLNILATWTYPFVCQVDVTYILKYSILPNVISYFHAT